MTIRENLKGFFFFSIMLQLAVLWRVSKEIMFYINLGIWLLLPNVTSLIQPMDQGVSNFLYQHNFLQQLLLSIDENEQLT